MIVKLSDTEYHDGPGCACHQRQPVWSTLHSHSEHYVEYRCKRLVDVDRLY